jgi:hypothetical protein
MLTEDPPDEPLRVAPVLPHGVGVTQPSPQRHYLNPGLHSSKNLKALLPVLRSCFAFLDERQRTHSRRGQTPFANAKLFYTFTVGAETWKSPG